MLLRQALAPGAGGGRLIAISQSITDQLAPAVRDPEGGHAAPAGVAKLIAKLAQWRGEA